MAEQSGWCFVVGKSTLCRWKVSSFSRGFCAPGAHGFLDFFGGEARKVDAALGKNIYCSPSTSKPLFTIGN